MLGPNLTSWAENVVKFQDKLSNKIIKTKKKQSGNGIGVQMKMESTHEALW